MANNNSIAYWDSITNTYSDSLPNPDVVTASIFNDMNSSALEFKWRNSVQRTFNQYDLINAYGTVPSGSRLMHECCEITFNDMTNSTIQPHRIILKFHLLNGNNEQIVTYYDFYDMALGKNTVHVDFGSDLFPITLRSRVEGGAANKLYIEFALTGNGSEFSYWIETNAPITTIFDRKNTLRNSSSIPQWLNLYNVLNNITGARKGNEYKEYVNATVGYQTKFNRLGETNWNIDGHTATLTSNSSYGSTFTVDRLVTNRIDSTTVNATNLTVSGTTNIATITNDNIYVSNIYAKNGTSFAIADPVVIGEGAMIFGTVTHVGTYNLIGGLNASSIDVSGNIDIDGVVKSDDFYPHTPFTTMQMNGAVNVTGTLMYDRLRANSKTAWSTSQTPTSLSDGNYDLQGPITIDLRTCANTAGDLYIFQGRRATEEGSDPSIIYKYPYYASTTADRTISVGGGYYTILVGTGTTGVFNALKP